MADLATLKIVVDASGAIRSVDSFRHATDKGSVAGARFEKQNQLVNAALRAVVVTIGAYVGTRFIAETVRMADTAKLLEGRLRLVSSSVGNLTFLERELTESAKRTRSGYEDTVTLYARVARNADQLGKSQAELLQFTELTQMAIKASGASAAEASAGMIQLSQALASGTLRGDEFRSVAEQMPALANAIADGLGVKSVGALRKLAFEGELTAEKVVDAVLKMDGSIRQDFATAPQLVSEAWRAMKDDVLRAVAEVDKGVNGTSKFATAIREFGDGIRDNLMAARIHWLDFEVSVTRALAVSDRAIAKSNLAIGAALQAASHGMLGNATVATAIGDIAELDALIDGLGKYREEQYNTIVGIKTLDQLLAETASTAAGTTDEVDRLAGAYARLAAAIKAPAIALNSRAGINTAITAGGLSIADISPQRGFTLGSGVMNLPAGFGIGNSMTAMRSDDAAVQAVIRWRAEMNKATGDVAKNFRENIQRSLGSFFSDFLTEGGNAVRNLFSNLSSLGADLIGQTLSKSLTPKFENLGFGQSLAVGAGLGILGSVVESFFSAGDAARAMAMAMAESARNIEQYARFATDRNLTPEQRAIRDQQEARDSLARRAVAAAGIHGFTGGLDEAQAFLQNDVWRTILGPRFDELVEQLETLDEAYAANADAAREAAREMERAAALQRIEALDRTIAGLEGFQTSLGMSNLSTLNPFQQLDLAKTEYNRILERAMSGDQDAAGQLPAAARAFLEQSRGVNASGARFASDFDRVNADTERVLALFEGQRTREQEALDVATNTLEVTQAIGTTLDTHTEIFGKGFGGIIERLDRTITRLDEVERGIRVGNEQRAA